MKEVIWKWDEKFWTENSLEEALSSRENVLQKDDTINSDQE